MIRFATARTALMLLAGLASSTALAGIYDELTAEQQKAVQNGQQVIVTEPVADSVWPKIIAYQRLDATPEESAAVLADYELQASYMPKLKRSKITARPDRATAIVDFRMAILIFSLDYTLSNHLSVYDRGASYKMDWKFVKGDSQIRDVRGGAMFEELGTGTIVRYTSLLVPSPSASGYKDKVIKMVRDGMAALSGQIQRERSGNQALLEKQKAMLREAVRTDLY